MSATAPEVLDLNLTELDFTPSLPCEYVGHPYVHQPADPAAWVVTVVCPACGVAYRYLLCDSGRQAHSAPGVVFECDGCGLVASWGTFVVSLDPIGGAR